MSTQIVNLYKEKYDVYIGRAGKGQSGYFGNPHKIGYCSYCGQHHSRVECLTAYRLYFYSRLETDDEFKRRINELGNKTLGCFCKPQTCHGDIIKEYLDENRTYQSG